MLSERERGQMVMNRYDAIFAVLETMQHEFTNAVDDCQVNARAALEVACAMLTMGVCDPGEIEDLADIATTAINERLAILKGKN